MFQGFNVQWGFAVVLAPQDLILDKATLTATIKSLSMVSLANNMAQKFAYKLFIHSPNTHLSRPDVYLLSQGSGVEKLSYLKHFFLPFQLDILTPLQAQE